MEFSFQSSDTGPEVLEALAEGYVRACELEIANAPDEFPCCVGCGQLQHYHARDFVGRHIEVAGPTRTVARGGGSAFELAVFQTAQLRRQGDPNAFVRVTPDLRVWIQRGDGTVEDPLAEAGGECGCGG